MLERSKNSELQISAMGIHSSFLKVKSTACFLLPFCTPVYRSVCINIFSGVNLICNHSLTAHIYTLQVL